MREEFTYIVQWEEAPEFCKIGKTTNPHTRLQGFLTVFPGTLKVLLVCDSEVLSEKNAHDLFKSHNYTGEHFHFYSSIKEKIDEINLKTQFQPYKLVRTISQTVKPGLQFLEKSIRRKYLRLARNRGMIMYRRAIPPSLIPLLDGKKELVRSICKSTEIISEADFHSRYQQAHQECEHLISSAKADLSLQSVT